jgi:mannose/fructose/N-acetylgalactosamine-specific phosphotransferase system component IIC
MIPNKDGYWYIAGLILANALNFLYVVGDFIGFFITSIAITAIFHNKKNRDFRGWEIIEIGATCSLTLFILTILFFILIAQQFPPSLFYALLATLVTRMIAVSIGIWVYNKLMKIK